MELVFTQLGQSMSLGLLRVLVREVLIQDILPMDMDLLLMVMDLVVSAPELVFTQLDQFTSLDLLRVLVREVLMLSLVITHRTTGHQLLLPTATLLAMDVMAREVLSPGILDLVMDMDMVVSAPELVFTQLVQFMSPDLLRVLASVVPMLSQDILVLAMAIVLVVSVLVLVYILLEQFMSPDLPKVSVADTCTKCCIFVLCNCQNIFLF